MTAFITYAPALVLLVVLTTHKLPSDRTGHLLPDLGIDAHATSVALLMSMTLQSAQPKPPYGTELILIHVGVLFVVTGLMPVTTKLHSMLKEKAFNLVGLGFFAFSMIWVYVMIFRLTIN